VETKPHPAVQVIAGPTAAVGVSDRTAPGQTEDSAGRHVQGMHMYISPGNRSDMLCYEYAVCACMSGNAYLHSQFNPFNKIQKLELIIGMCIHVYPRYHSGHLG